MYVTGIFQDFVKYQLTVRENIGFGNLNLMHKDNFLFNATLKAGAKEVILSLPRKLNEQLGTFFNNGIDLSTGQWQKIALSRMFLRDAEVYFLDEPTASLDPIAELKIFEQFSNVTKNKTTITISHRLGSCKNADKILVLRNGFLIEQGTHEELMELDGYYASMYLSQAKWYK